MKNVNMLALAGTSPTQFFEDLKAAPFGWWIAPLSNWLLNSLATAIWLYRVDMDWYKSLTAPPSSMSTPAAAAIMDQVFNPETILAIGSTVGAVGTLLALLFSAIFLYLAGKIITSEPIPFRNWLALTGWSTLPLSLLAVTNILALSVGNPSHLLAGQLNPLVLNFWVNSQDRHSMGLFESLSLAIPFAAFFRAVGFRAWTGTGWAISIAISSIPNLTFIALMYFLSVIGN